MMELRNDEPDEFEEENEIEEQQAGQLAYEREYENDYSWEQLEEDEEGNLKAPDSLNESRARRLRTLQASDAARIQRGLIRYLQVVVDFSIAATGTDMRPMRGAVMVGALTRFIRAFFDENPLSHMGLISMRDGVATIITGLSSSPESHVEKLKAALQMSGDASLQNALDLATDGLRGVPPYGQREVLFLFAGLSSCDPGSIHSSILAAKKARVQISVVGLSAEVFICKEMTQMTGGRHTVAMDESHLRDLVMEHAMPPPLPAGSDAFSLIKMGFPGRASQAVGAATFAGAECTLMAGAFVCPRCQARVCELPSECHICKLTLVSASHLSRSYHHLFPIPIFEEITDPNSEETLCGGCSSRLSKTELQLQCPKCKGTFCMDCDVYIHKVLHNCPGCEGFVV